MADEKSPNPKNTDDEYIKIEAIILKKGMTQQGVLDFIRRCNIFGMEGSCIEVKEIAITGIEPVNEDSELDEIMNAAVTGATSEIMQERLDDAQDIMAQKFFEKHPMWFVITNCPKCGTPNIDFPCKRCGYE